MPYNPTRVWNIEQTDITFANNNLHWLYVKVPIANGITTTELIASELHIDPVAIDDYIMYKLGFAAAVADGRREIHMLWGNAKPRNGKSAYELAVVNGFVGTEVEWLASLIGHDGAPGAPGDDGAPGAPGAPGSPGDDGREVELRENAGWVEWRYVGDIAWTQLYEIPEGGGTGGSEAPELHLDFEDAGDEFVYNVPYNMKFTSQVSEAGDATLDIALDTDMPRYTKLTITASATGLVSLYGEFVTI